MAELNFSQVEAALIEPNVSVMRGMRDALIQLGIQKAHPYSAVADVAAAFLEQPPDLVVIDIDNPEIDGFKVIRWLRNDADYPNPFLCIIATTWQPTEALFQRVNNSGADALLVKPASPRQLMDRVLAVVEGRKKFVVTADYTGPDRRKQLRAGVHIPSFDAPNTLRLKATGEWERAAGRSLVANGIAWINEQKAIRDAFQISFLINYAEPGLATNPPDRLAVDHLLRVPAVIEDLLKRVAKRGLDSRFETACKGILMLIERVCRSAEPPPPTDLGQLRTLGLGLMRTLHPSRSADVLAKEVAGAVSAYSKRLDQLRAARAAQGAALAADGAARVVTIEG
jgi:DNA-binding response OmpR family regulator